jgi:predicted dehydrogenase
MAVTVGLVGAGNIAQIHLEALQRARGVEVVGIFDQDQARARDHAAAFGVPRVYAVGSSPR